VFFYALEITSFPRDGGCDIADWGKQAVFIIFSGDALCRPIGERIG
jgi:hypothetical protein